MGPALCSCLLCALVLETSCLVPPELLVLPPLPQGPLGFPLLRCNRKLSLGSKVEQRQDSPLWFHTFQGELFCRLIYRAFASQPFITVTNT